LPRTIAIRDVDEWNDFLDEIERPRPRKTTKQRTADEPVVEILADEEDVIEGAFNPSFTGSKHERQWIYTYLSPFYQDHQIVDVLRQVKGGKEATVYCCKAHPSTGLDLVAAKVYRPRIFRNFKNDSEYWSSRLMLDGEGKAMRDKRYAKAVQQGTRFGQEARFASWLYHEFSSLTLLHAAGAAVPKPIAHDDNAILMEYFGEEATAAPTLSQVSLSREEAPALFEFLMRNVELMLQHDRIHGDLSAYNVLYWEGKVTIIDFPQVIDAYQNQNAYRFLRRDVERLCQYFTRHGVRSDPERIASGMWRRAMPDETYQVRGSRW
jgi:RIO kinase 1